MRYNTWWDWISGEKLKETVGKASADGKTQPPQIYPLEINPVLWITAKHSEALWGEVPDDSSGMVTFEYRKPDKTKDKRSEEISDAINHIWYQNHPKEILARGGFHSQYLGGAAYRVVQDNSKKYNVRIDNIIPDYFLPVFDSSDPWNLLESWVVNYISREEAQANYGMDVPTGIQRLVLSEHWTKDYYEILVNGEVPKSILGDSSIPNAGENPIGKVPYVYIPHYVRATTQYGISHVPSIEKMIYEVNTRMADAGDYIQENSGGDYVIRNSTSQRAVTLPNGKQAINIGVRQPGMDNPELDRLQTSAINGDIHLKLPYQIMDLIQRDGSVPDIAWGKDEGSQRSGISQAFKMMPLVSHIRRERMMWTEAFKQLNELILLWTDALETFRASEEAANDYLCFTQWEAITPRDRLEVVNEVVTRRGAGLISRRRALEMLNTGEDIDEELALIKADEEAAQAQSMNQTPVLGSQTSANAISREANA